MPEIKKRKIIFVDDEPKILQGLHRMFHSMRQEWEMTFVEGGAEALSFLEKGPFDVLVTDMRMPGMDGVRLLSEVQKRFPDVIRIVLSGYSDHQMVLKSVPLAHQFLAKPCDPQTIISAVSSACALNDSSGDGSLKKLVAQVTTLPSLPALYIELERLIRTDDCSINRIVEIISQDMGMMAKVLQLANSAFFGLPRKISSPSEAVLFIGLKALQAMILSAHIFAHFQNVSRFQAFIDDLWHHSQATAGIADLITSHEGFAQPNNGYASMAGLLHDCGKLILADNFPDKYEQALLQTKRGGVPIWQAEENIFGAHHGSVGAYLLGIWGLPTPMIEALAFHHHPSSFPHDHFNVLTAIHAADVLEQEERALEDQDIKFDQDYLFKLGLESRLSEWRILVKEFKKKGAQP
jgi:HD-like signal output (HDOD) protein/CheY-like chemotaxis protein